MDNPTGQVLLDGDKADHNRRSQANQGPERREGHGRIGRAREKSNRTNNRKSRSLIKFLLDSEVKPVVFVGRCVQQFGWGAVIGFCLGAAGVYGYAFTAKSLPLVTLAKEQSKDAATATQTSAIQKRWLHGVVMSGNRPVTEDIEIGVLATRNGPFPSGKFSIQVPQSDRYLFTLWNQGVQRFRLVEVIPDVDGNVDVIFPSGVVEAQVSNERNPRPNTDAQVESTSSQIATRSTRQAASQPRSSVATR